MAYFLSPGRFTVEIYELVPCRVRGRTMSIKQSFLEALVGSSGLLVVLAGQKDINLSGKIILMYEPLSNLLGKDYFLHAYGPIYALSADVVASLVALRNDSFRMFSNEDVTIGAWMLAMNVNHEDNRALCQAECTPSAVAVWDIPKCSGLCNPESRLLELHKKDSCSNSPTMESDD